MVMTSFRRSLKAETKKTGKGGKGFWRERWRLPTTHPTPMLFMDASYVDPNPAPEQVEVDPQTGRPKEVRHAFFKVRKHRRRIPKNGGEWFADEICSAGYDPHNPQPCSGCYWMDQGDKSLTVSDYFLFGAIHLAPYHGHPVLDEKNNIMMKKDGSGWVINFAECEGRQCNYCRTLAGVALVPDNNWPNWQQNHISTIFGQRRYLEIGKGHLANLESWDNTVSSMCSNCNSQLITDGFKCPRCHNRVIDMATDPRTDEQILEAAAHQHPCMYCNCQVLLIEEVSCDACEARGGQGAPYPFFGTVLHALREGEKMKSQMVLRRFETLSSFERTVMGQQLMFGATIGQICQGKSLQQIVQELDKPYDFPEMMKPKDLREQAKRLELEPPPSAGGQQSVYSAPGGFQPYGAGQQQQQNQQAANGLYSGPQGQQYGGGAAQTWGTGPGHTGNTGPQPHQGNWQQGNNPQGQQGFVGNQQQGFVGSPQQQGGQQTFQQGQGQQGFVPNQQGQTQQPQGPQPFIPNQRPNFS
jgi:hypothetical protein